MNVPRRQTRPPVLWLRPVEPLRWMLNGQRSLARQTVGSRASTCQSGEGSAAGAERGGDDPLPLCSGLPCTQVFASGTSTTSVPVPTTALNPERLSATGHGAWPPGASSLGGFVRAQAGSAEPEHTRDRRFGAALSCRSDQETSSLWGVSASWSYGRDVLCDNIWREARVSEARGGREPSICVCARGRTTFLTNT